MNKSLIYTALAFKDDGTSKDIKMKGMSIIEGKEMYLRNAFVSLVSAKRFKIADVALITNLPLSDKWTQLFNKQGIQVYIHPFNQFRFEGYNWELAFYKLCAMDYVSTFNYENYLLVDADTFFLRSPSIIFEEVQAGNVLLYEVLHDIHEPMRKLINDGYNNFTSSVKIISQMGGEFVAANSEDLKRLISFCKFFYNQYIEKNEICQAIGDEYFLSMAVAEMKNVRNATPYIERHWTRGNAYYATTRYSDNQCILIHCIAEKKLGFNYLFMYYMKYHDFPSINKIASICNLPKLRGKSINYYTLYVLLDAFWRKLFKK